jgi:hypothetical protein
MTAPLNTASLVSELRERWEATDAPVAKKINRLLKLASRAAAALESTSRALSEKEGELAEARAEAKGWQNAAHLSACEAGSGLLEEATRQRDEALAALKASEERGRVLREAVKAVTDATCAYLPPDGISKDELISRVLAATDNPEINAVMLGGRNGSP